MVLVARPRKYWDLEAIFPETTERFQYTPEDLDKIKKRVGPCLEKTPGIKTSPDGRMILPSKERYHYVQNLHQLTHLGSKKLKELVQGSDYYILDLPEVLQEVTSKCQACAFTNAGHHHKVTGTRLRGDRPGAYWDFTEVKPAKYGYRYLLVFVHTFSGWVEAFPMEKRDSTSSSKKDPGRNIPQV